MDTQVFEEDILLNFTYFQSFTKSSLCEFEERITSYRDENFLSQILIRKWNFLSRRNFEINVDYYSNLEASKSDINFVSIFVSTPDEIKWDFYLMN